MGKISSVGMNTKFGKALKKSTTAKYCDPPKSKHILTLLGGLNNQDSKVRVDEAICSLKNRIADNHWRTSFKALIITHHALQTLDSTFAAKMMIDFPESNQTPITTIKFRGSYTAQREQNVFLCTRLKISKSFLC